MRRAPFQGWWECCLSGQQADASQWVARQQLGEAGVLRQGRRRRGGELGRNLLGLQAVLSDRQVVCLLALVPGQLVPSDRVPLGRRRAFDLVGEVDGLGVGVVVPDRDFAVCLLYTSPSPRD